MSLLLLFGGAGGPPPTFVAAWAEVDDDDWCGAMKKNVASQTVGRQMVSATDGSAFTSTVTVYVTGDNGAQAIGSVGSGICTHEGNGYHTYSPAQAETNYDKVAFTFIGTGAIPRTLEIWTTFPQTGDSFARIGAPTGASIAADLVTIDDFLDTEVAAIKAKTDLIPASPASTTNITAATGITVSALGAGVITAASIATGAIDADALAADAVAEIADGVWDEARSGHTTAGTYGEANSTIVSGTCITGTLSTTQATTNLTEATDDHYIGRTIVWVTGVLAGQASAITDYAGATKTLTYTAVTDAPSNNDRFVLV